jgi:hypothetical protein
MARDTDTEYLGAVGAIWKRISGASEGAVLREALDGLFEDRSFEMDHEDRTFYAFDRKVSPEIPFIVAGHTHHRRALARKRGRGFYFNSGTWAYLMRVTPAMLNDEQAMTRLGRRLREGTLEQLRHEGYLLEERTVVRIAADGDHTRGSLCNVSLRAPTLVTELKHFMDAGV